MHRIRPQGMVKPAKYRPFPPRSRIKHWLYEKYKTPADESGDGYLLHDYYQLSDLVKSLPTIQEKIDMVNPYERSWHQGEKTWHRAWMPELCEPRKAWAVPSVPQFFNTLNFYKYITKSRVYSKAEGRERLDIYYKDVVQPSTELIARLEKRLAEILICHLTREKDVDEDVSLRNAFRVMFEDLYTFSVDKTHRVGDLRLSHTPRCESFWIRAGFKKFYKEHKVYLNEVLDVTEPFVGDDRRMLGQLSFTMRDSLVSQTRVSRPIRNLFEWSNTDELYAPVFTESVDLENEVLFDPVVYKLSTDSKILWQCPGYEPDSSEPCMYGALALKNSSDLSRNLQYWRPESVQETEEIRENFYVSTALMSLFNWLNGQAHCTGNTQFTDIERPITSQLIVSNGQEFCFAVSQLNTIAINLDVEGFVNKHTNLCCVEGPCWLYDVFDAATGTFKHKSDENGPLKDGLNPYVMKRLLQMCLNH